MIEQRSGKNSSLSILVPAAVALLPALMLGFLPGERGELFDWLQHLAAGLAFGVVFVITFLFGGWRRHWAGTCGGTGVASLVALLIWRHGLPGFQVIFAIAGLMVGSGYWFSQRREPAMVVEAALVAFCSMLGFWALSQLSWWVPFGQTLASWGNRLWFLTITAAVTGFLCVWHRVPVGTSPGRTFRLLDAAMLGVLAVAVIRTTDLAGNIVADHHWSVYVGPAEMVREGRALLGQVPSQYGFLSILVLAGLPASSCFGALYWMQVTTLWLSGAVIYFVLRTWLAAWWWQIGAGLVATICVAFLCGDLSQLSGPMVYPNVGAVRFIWVHLVLGYLFWWQLTAAPQASTRRMLWIGSVFWLLGVLWSVESALYVTATWLPAASLLAMPAGDHKLSVGGRLRALGAGIGLSLGIVALYLAGAMALVATGYELIYHQAPQWTCYLEYARAFTGGSESLTFPIDPWGAGWALLLLHSALLAALVSVIRGRHLALIWAAWGAFWSVSTYYIARSHANNISNLGPVLLLVIGLLVHVAKVGEPRGLLRPWAWIVVATWLGAMLWLVATNSSAVQRQLVEYQVTPRVDRLLPDQAEVRQLLSQCQRTQPDPFSVIGINNFACVPLELTTAHPNWLPLRSLPLYGPLSLERRAYYLDAYHGRTLPGWLLAPLRLEEDLSWLFNYIDARYTVTSYLRNDGWQAWHFVPKDRREFWEPHDQPTSAGLYHNPHGADETLQFMRKFRGNVDSRLLSTSARFYDPGEGPGLIGVAANSGEMRVNFPSNRLQAEMVLRRADRDAGGLLAADFAVYASPADRPEVRFERWRGRIDLPAGQKEVSVSREIDGSGLSTLFTVEIPPEFAGRLIAGWRNPNVTHVSQDSAVPAWLAQTREPAMPMDETALARLLPDNWRPVEAWMRRAYVGAQGIELSPGGEIWLKARDAFTKLSGTSLASAPDMRGRETGIHGLWYKGGRMHWYEPAWPQDPTADRPFFAVGAESGGWLVIAADPNPAYVPALVRVIEVTETK